MVDGARRIEAPRDRPCVLEALRAARRSGVKVPKYRVVADACRACGICYNLLKCYAITRPPLGKYVVHAE